MWQHSTLRRYALVFYTIRREPNKHQIFEQEVYVWVKLDHPNILPLLGYAIEPTTGYPIIVSEWMHNGSAWSYLQKNPDLPFASILGIVSLIAVLSSICVANLYG